MASRPPDYDDLRGFDLSKLDLEHIDLAHEDESSVGRWLGGLLLAGVAGVLAYLPRSDSLSHLMSGPLSFVASLVAVLLGIAAGRWLLATAEAARRRARLEDLGDEPEGPPTAAARWFTLLVGAGGAGAVVYGVRGDSSGLGTGMDSFITCVGAIVVGLVLGRWLVMQAEAAKAAAAGAPEPEPITLPPWFKWVTLAALVGLALVALAGRGSAELSGDSGDGFLFGGVAFAVGLLGAIWLARRFDELEEQARSRRGGPPGER